MLRLLFAVALVLLFAFAAAGPEHDPLELARAVEFYRAAASLRRRRGSGLSGAVFEHARYMVMHGVVRALAESTRSWATPKARRRRP